MDYSAFSRGVVSSVELLTDTLTGGLDETIWLTLGSSSDLRGLKHAVESYATPQGKWKIGWAGIKETTYTHRIWPGIVDLIVAIVQLDEVDVSISVPLRPGDTLKLVETLLPRCCASRLEFYSLEPLPGISEEETENEFIKVLDEISNWEKLQSLEALYLLLPVSLNPNGRFLNKLAEVLPDIVALKELAIYLKEPAGFDINDQVFVADFKQAIEKVQEGLEKNYTLEQFFILPTDLGMSRDESSELWKLSGKLMRQKMQPLLRLNRRGRGHIVSMPLHRDTWLEIVARYTDDASLDAVFYYLRKNTWMFTPEIDLEAQNRCLVKEMSKRQRENEEEVQSLVAELGAEKKRRKTELEAKDEEIRKLQVQLLQAKTVD